MLSQGKGLEPVASEGRAMVIVHTPLKLQHFIGNIELWNRGYSIKTTWLKWDQITLLRLIIRYW